MASTSTHTYSRKVLRMVSELHLRGYQRLRISPGLSPSGCYWRCAVTPRSNALATHGALMRDGQQAALYSSGMEDGYFGWTDACQCSPNGLAALFLERFPAIARAGFGSDWLYAGWFSEMLHLTYRDAFPVAFADYGLPDGYLCTVGSLASVRVPLPPPGEAVPEDGLWQLTPENAVAHWGGVLVRVLETLNCFHARYGIWPTKLYLPSDAFAVLQNHHLTPLGFAALQSKLLLLRGDDFRLAAQDETGRGLDYSIDGWSTSKPNEDAPEVVTPKVRAMEWLGFQQGVSRSGGY